MTQLGVTIASLGLGWAGEGTLYQLLSGALQNVKIDVPSYALRGVAFALSFLVISYTHVIIGEVVPKNVAIEKADRVALLAAPVLLIFYRISGPFVAVIERSSALILRAFGVTSSSEGGGHTAEELKYIIQSSRHEGHLEQFEQDAIQRLIELSDYSAREIMTPRHNIVSLPANSGLDEVLTVMAEHKYARVPVYEDRPEQIIGIVHYKDLVRVVEDRRFALEKRRTARPFRLRRFLRKPAVVPETKPLNQLIDEFRKSHTHMALVVDEFGTVSGLVTLEDVLEQIFGDMGDEHDVIRPAISYEEEGAADRRNDDDPRSRDSLQHSAAERRWCGDARRVSALSIWLYPQSERFDRVQWASLHGNGDGPEPDCDGSGGKGWMRWKSQIRQMRDNKGQRFARSVVLLRCP